MAAPLTPISQFEGRFLLSSMALGNTDSSGRAKPATREILQQMAEAAPKVALCIISPSFVETLDRAFEEVNTAMRAATGATSPGQVAPAVMASMVGAANSSRYGGAMLASAVAEVGLTSYVDGISREPGNVENVRALQYFMQKATPHQLGDCFDLARIDIITYLVQSGGNHRISAELLRSVERNCRLVDAQAARAELAVVIAALSPNNLD